MAQCINPGDTFKPKMVFSDYFSLFINLLRYGEGIPRSCSKLATLNEAKGANLFRL